jgi:hypothetical protein
MLDLIDRDSPGFEPQALASVGFSRNAAVVNSQGREPLVKVHKTMKAPTGAKVAFAPVGACKR